MPEGPEPADEPATTAAQPPAATSEPAAASTATDIHELSIAGTGPAAYVASGQVRGRLLDDFAMSEHDGVLRVATTDGWPAPGGSSESMVTTLSRQGDELVTLSQLGGLGRGEQIQAVRFVGATGFVVTYRQTDPLYVVDLSDPARPQARGELQLLGFSAYLHPIGDGRLLGIGQDATAEGRRTGAQVALFDVSDLDAPRLVAKAALPQGWSEVEQDYHAFLWWAPTRLAGVPMQLYGEPGGGEPFSGLVAFTVSPEQLSETGRIAHPAPSGPDPCTGGPPPEPGESRGSVTGDGPVTVPAAGATAAVPAVGAPTAVAPAMPPLLCAPWTAAPAITRAVVVGDTLYTLSVAGVMSTSLADLTQTGYVPFG